MHIQRLLGEARPGLNRGMTPPTHGVTHPLCGSSTGGGANPRSQRQRGEPRHGEIIGDMQRVLKKGGAKDTHIHSNTRQSGVRQGQRVLQGEVQHRPLHTTSQQQMQHPEPPPQLQWVWTLQRGGTIQGRGHPRKPLGCKMESKKILKRFLFLCRRHVQRTRCTPPSQMPAVPGKRCKRKILFF